MEKGRRMGKHFSRLMEKGRQSLQVKEKLMEKHFPLLMDLCLD